MVAVKSNKPLQYGIYAVMALLLLAAIFHASGGPTTATTITQHAPWAYRPKPQAGYNEHAAEKHTVYDDDVYDDERDSNSTAQSPGPSSALADEDELEGPVISSSSSFAANNGDGKWAFATFLSTSEEDKPDDAYFTACRTLVYQLLHHPKTKTNREIPLLILAPEHAHKRKLDMLTDEGAKVIKVDPMEIDNDWTDANTGMKASDHFARLRMWEMKQYERILYIDAATLLMRSIDEIFDEALVGGEMRSLGKIESIAGFDNLGVPAPQTYFLASVSDAKDSKHEFPPRDDFWLSQGFYMLRPDLKMYKYYEAILKNAEGLFDRNRLMAGLLNHAHKREGPMPWVSFKPGKWNINYPGKQDLAGGVATLHTKFWDGNNREWLARELVEMWWRIQGQMEGFWFRRGYGAPKVFE